MQASHPREKVSHVRMDMSYLFLDRSKVGKRENIHTLPRTLHHRPICTLLSTITSNDHICVLQDAEMGQTKGAMAPTLGFSGWDEEEDPHPDEGISFFKGLEYQKTNGIRTASSSLCRRRNGRERVKGFPFPGRLRGPERST